MKILHIKLKLLALVLSLSIVLGCTKEKNGVDAATLHADGYIIGFSPCIANGIINTPEVKGKGYLIETIASNPDTLMMFGFPPNLVDIPEEWIQESGAHLIPIEGRKLYKVRVSYKALNGANVGALKPCKAMYWMPYPPPQYLKKEYVVIKAEKL